MKISGNLGLLD